MLYCNSADIESDTVGSFCFGEVLQHGAVATADVQNAVARAQVPGNNLKAGVNTARRSVLPIFIVVRTTNTEFGLVEHTRGCSEHLASTEIRTHQKLFE